MRDDKNRFAERYGGLTFWVIQSSAIRPRASPKHLIRAMSPRYGSDASPAKNPVLRYPAETPPPLLSLTKVTIHPPIVTSTPTYARMKKARTCTMRRPRIWRYWFPCVAALSWGGRPMRVSRATVRRSSYIPPEVRQHDDKRKTDFRSAQTRRTYKL